MTKNKVAIITAGGGGIGEAISRELKNIGYDVSIMSRSDRCEKLAEELGGIAVRGCVTKKEDLERLVKTTYEHYGRIDSVVNHTGHPPKGDLLELSDESWIEGLELIILNVVRMARLVTPIMLQQKKGSWVNISTFAAFEPELKLPISCTLRAGLSSFAKLYANKYAHANIRMNNVLPGFIDSLPHGSDIADQVPMRRIGKVNEIANTARFLLSEDSGYITGQNLIVDGGITRHI